MDNNIDLAKVWGKTHYNNDYYVIKINLDLNQDNCYDLVGNRSHQIHFIKLLEEFAEETGISKLEKWSVNQWIEMIKELKKESPEIFPWKMVRAVDLLNHERYSRAQKMIKFIEAKNNYTIVNPKIVICVFNKEDLNLKSKETTIQKTS